MYWQKANMQFENQFGSFNTKMSKLLILYSKLTMRSLQDTPRITVGGQF